MSRTAGSRNESGFVNSLDRQGFTDDKCLAEELANSCDAFADKFIFNISPDGSNIDAVETGIGMISQRFEYMFDAGRENHLGEKSMGVSGIGGLIAKYQLSKNDAGQPTEVSVYTKHKDDIHLKAIVPWGVIHREKKYDGQIVISPMNEDEIQQFVSERNGRLDATGTTFKFPYTERLNQLLNNQFKSVQTDCSNLDKSLSVIFGKTKMKILLNKHDGLPPTEMKKYDYFGGPENAYYRGKFVCDIYCLHDNRKVRFICKDPTDETQNIEITQNATGFSKQPKRVQVDPRKLEAAEIITFTSGMRTDDNLFNPLFPKEPTAEFHLNPYDGSFMRMDQQKDVVKEWMSKLSVYRNGQRITGVPLDAFKVSSARAGGEELIRICCHRAELSYETESRQENRLDHVHRIQQNKNQNQNDFPKQYTRLIEYLKNYHYQKINTYFKNVIAEYKRKMIEQEAQRKIEEQSRRAEERRIAEEQRRQNEGTQQPEDEIQLVVTGDNNEIQLVVTGDNDHDHDEAVAEIGIPTDATEESEESEESGDEVLDQDNKDCESEQIITTTDSDNCELDSPNIEEQQPISSESDESAISEVEESREYDLKLIQLLSERIATANYAHRNGKMLYEYVISQREN